MVPIIESPDNRNHEYQQVLLNLQDFVLVLADI